MKKQSISRGGICVPRSLELIALAVINKTHVRNEAAKLYSLDADEARMIGG